ncbi:MAG: hypothetical protein PVI44_04340 [Balneolaceae bacterium]|jgi:hypothetical protein
MKYLNKIFWISIVIFLIILNLYSFYREKDLNQDLNNVRTSLVNSQHNFRVLQENTLYREAVQYKNDRKQLDGDLVLTKGTNSHVHHTFKSMLFSGNNLIFDLSGINCFQCSEKHVGKELSLIKNLIKEFGSDHIITIAHYRNKSDLNLFKRLNNIDFDIYNKGDGRLGLPIEKRNVPFLFITSFDLKAKYIFIPDKELPKLSERYFTFIESKLK